MPYRLVRGEPVAQGLKRIATEEIDSAIAHLREEDESLRNEGIHEARKSIKKVRGIIRLLMPGLGDAGTKGNIALRNTGRALSNLRDAAALIETVEILSEHYSAHPAMEPLAVVRSALRRRMEDTVRGEDCRTVAGGAVAALKVERRRINRWLIGGEFSAIGTGLQDTYRRGRKALKQSQGDPTPENLHRLRRRAKDHWYHVRLLEGPWREASAHNREKHLGQLQDWLGEDHNLTVLRQAIEADPAAFGGKQIVPAVLDLISTSQKDLQDSAMKAAARLYSDKPKAHLQKIAEVWSAWQKDSSLPKPSDSRVAKPRTSAA